MQKSKALLEQERKSVRQWVTGRYWSDIRAMFGKDRIDEKHKMVEYNGEWYECKMQNDYCIGLIDT